MTSFLPPLSTATAPHNEIICPELRILGAYLPRTQNFRGWPAQKIPAAELIPPQKSPKNCRGEWSDFVRGNRAKPHPYFSYTFRPLLYPAGVYCECTASMGARTYPEAYFAENMVAIHPATFVLKFQLGNHMVFTNKISKEKLLGGTAGVFSNWLTFGSIPKGT